MSVGGSMADRRPAMAGIPHEVGCDDRQRDDGRQGKVAAGRAPWPTRSDNQEDSQAEQEIAHRVFGKKPKTEGPAEHYRPSPIRLRVEMPDRQQRQRPEEQQRHVGRNDEAGEDHARQGRVDQRREEADALVEQSPPDICDDDTGRGMEQRRPHPDRPLLIAGDGGGGRDQPGDDGRLGEIAVSQMARPRPVLRLIRQQVERAVAQRQKPGEGDEKIDRDRPHHPGARRDLDRLRRLGRRPCSAVSHRFRKSYRHEPARPRSAAC